MKMSLIPSSKGTAALVALVIAMAAVGTAAAVTASDISAPDEAQVGEEVTAEVTLTELYAEEEDWTLRGTTELENVTSWQITQTFSNGSEETESFDGQSEFELEMDSSDNYDSVTVSITGDAPSVESFSYDPPQSFNAATLTKLVGEGENDIETVEVHHYTNESKEASDAIREAQESVNESDNADAESDLQDAIEFYESENFERAIDNADRAREATEDSQQSQDTTPLLLYGAGALVVLALIGGGVYYYRNQQDSYDKLR
ncbi:MAG: hypothetical protein ACOCY1_04295 [Halovenus sp.]